MPVYEAQCPQCGVVVDYLRSVAECLDTPLCDSCGVRTDKKVFSVPHGFMRGNFAPFKSTVDGTLISNHRDMQEHNKRNNVVSLADGYSDERLKRGDFTAPAAKTDNKKELMDDLMAASIKVRDGYKPTIGAYDE